MAIELKGIRKSERTFVRQKAENNIQVRIRKCRHWIQSYILMSGSQPWIMIGSLLEGAVALEIWQVPN